MITERRARHTDTAPPLLDDGSSRLLVATGHALWDNAALLVVISLLLLIVSMPSLILASVAGWWVAWLPMVLTLAPVWFAAILVGDRILDGYGVAVRNVPAFIVDNARTALGIALVPAVAGQLTLTLAHLADRETGEQLAQIGLLLSLGVLLSVAILGGPTFASAARFGTGTRDAWILGARVVATAPLQQLGLVGCFAVLIWLLVDVVPVVLLALAPFAVLTAAVARVPQILFAGEE